MQLLHAHGDDEFTRSIEAARPFEVLQRPGDLFPGLAAAAMRVAGV